MSPAENRVRQNLVFLYGQPAADHVWQQLRLILDEFTSSYSPAPRRSADLTEKDALLITYGDNFQAPGQAALQTLERFVTDYLAGAISGIHILPFFRYSSDDGFSVIDYREIDSNLGSWDDIASLGRDYRLMFDAVINHVSQESEWFQAYLRDESPYRDYFITAQPGWDLSQVVRPRTLPLLTDVDTARGRRSVWTTFSSDQIDLNYANPQVLLEIIALLLFYVKRGAALLRLDAIAYLWKQPGTTCIHLPQTHAVIKILRAVLDLVAPHVLLISETNVPHQENISYFGESLPETGLTSEAQLVYQFPLAPLILHTFASEDASQLHAWAAGLEGAGLFFNFTASHDGIGVMPAKGILTETQIQGLADRALAHQGLVSYKSNPDGSHSPYELNITFFDALNPPSQADSTFAIDRFIASQVITLSLAGVPGIYVHSLFGSSNCHACLQETARARSLNRAKFDYGQLLARLDEPHSREARILQAYRRLLQIRGDQPAFHPAGSQRVIDNNPGIFSLQRTSRDGQQTILCLVNVTSTAQVFRRELTSSPLPPVSGWRDLIGGKAMPTSHSTLEIHLQPYQYCWLVPSRIVA